MDKQKNVTVQVNSNNKEALSNASLYLVNQSGKIVESYSLEKGKALLKNDMAGLQKDYKIWVGPNLPKDVKSNEISIKQLAELGAFQPSVLIDRNQIINIKDLPIWKLPLFFRCLITGNITKDFFIDNQTKSLPVCNARVHICEVDPIRIFRPEIPDWVIDDFLDKLKDKLYPIPNPIPDPRIPKIPPIFSPIPPIPPIFNSNVFGRINPTLKTNVNNISKTTINNIAIKSDLPLSVDIQQKVFLSNREIAKNTLLENLQLFRPYICLWPKYWPYFYKCDPIATVYTDCNGKFDHFYWNFNNDKDIYIWVEVNINGEWVTVYKPNIPCHTNWNYTCGKEINIKLTDPRVAPCFCTEDVAGDIVWFQSIGESATPLKIEQSDSSVELVQGVNVPNVGCISLWGSSKIRPFGEHLGFKLLFGNGFPNTNITHYRWRKKQLKNATLSSVVSSPSIIGGNISKSYYIITNEGGTYHFETHSVNLGVIGEGDNMAYRIPTWNIYDDPGVPAADKARTIQWTSPNFYSMAIDSNGLEPGLWEFELQLGRYNSSGNFIVANVNDEVFQVTDANNFGSSVPAPSNYLNFTSPGIANGLKIKVRIDNAKCEAAIDDALLLKSDGTTQASGECGFLHYTNTSENVIIKFEASHPRNFAVFSFTVVKGNNTTSPNINANGFVGSSVDGYTLMGDRFVRNVLVSRLLGRCPQASFAEHLHVQALATNGSRVLDEYNDGDLESFALSDR